MNNTFYHDALDGIQKVRCYPVIAEHDITVTTDFDEVGQIVATTTGDIYLYTPALAWKKISVAE